MFFDVLQFIGGIILAIGYIPQIKQIIKTRSCRDLNLGTYLSLTLGILLMEVYALNLAAKGVGRMFLVTNSISLLLTATISVLIIVYRWKAGKKE